MQSTIPPPFAIPDHTCTVYDAVRLIKSDVKRDVLMDQLRNFES
jgi:hypothetical protein